MTSKRIRLPKEGLVEPDKRVPAGFVDGTSDVEGHSWTNPAPPIDFSKRTPSGGGELTPKDDDAAGSDDLMRSH